MEKAKCFVCLKSSRLDKGSCKKFNLSDLKPLENELQVIFLLRKFLRIPSDMCCKFLQDYGNPSAWIHCCKSCSVSILDAKRVFDSIERLKKKYEYLQLKFLNTILTSVRGQSENEITEMGVAEIVRYYVCQEFENKNNLNPVHGPEDDESSNFVHSSSDVECITVSDNDDVMSVMSLEFQDEPKSSKGKTQECTAGLTNPFLCSVCNKTFCTFYTLRRHEETHTVRKSYCCDQCKKSFLDPHSLSKHVESAHDKGKSSKGINSPEKFPSEETIELYEDTNSLENTEKITSANEDSCKKRKSNVLNKSKEILTGGKPYLCDTCDKSFSRQNHLTRHQMIHTGRKPYCCEKCEKCFADPSSLCRHVDVMHNKEKEDVLPKHKKNNNSKRIRYFCPVCNRFFTSLQGLKSHENIHSEENIESSEETEHHQETESYFLRKPKEIPANDENLHSSYSSQSPLRRLERVHTKIECRNYLCDFCKKRFLTLSHVKRHERLHTGEKPYECDQCDMRYSDSSMLKKHRKIHKKH